jgi:integrase
MASIYRRGQTWWMKYYVGGKAVRRSLKTRNAREARKICEQYSAAEKIGLLAEASSTPIGPFLQDICEYWKRTRKCKGAANDISRLRRFFGPVCPALEYGERTESRHKDSCRSALKAKDEQTGRMIPVKRLEQLTPEILSRVLQDWLVETDVTGKTINRYRGVLSSMFTYARKHHGYVCPDPRYKNPIEGVDRFPERNHTIRWLNADEIDEQLAVLDDHPQLRAMVAVAIFAGPRREAITWLTRDDVDLHRRVLHIQAKTIDGQFWEPKTGRNRSIPISTRLQEILSDYAPPGGSIWFFPSPDGERWHPDNYSLKLRTMNQHAGLTWSSMDFRHTFGSHLAQKGVSLYKISSLMGNSPEICRKHYAALQPHEMRDEVEFGTKRTATGPAGSEDPATQQLLQQLLAKVERLERQDGPPDDHGFRIVK